MLQRISLDDEAAMRVSQQAGFFETEVSDNLIDLASITIKRIATRVGQATGAPCADRLEIDERQMVFHLGHAQVVPVDTGTTGVSKTDRTLTGNVVALFEPVDHDAMRRVRERQGTPQHRPGRNPRACWTCSPLLGVYEPCLPS